MTLLSLTGASVMAVTVTPGTAIILACAWVLVTLIRAFIQRPKMDPENPADADPGRN